MDSAPHSMSLFTRRVLLVIGLLAAAAATLLLLWQIGSIVVLVFAGVLFGVFLHGLSAYLSRWTGWRYGFWLPIVVIVLVGAFGFLLYRTAPALASQLQNLQETISESVQEWGNKLEQWPLIDSLLDGNMLSKSDFEGRAANWLTRFFTSTFGAIVDILVIFFIGLYLAVAPPLYRNGLVRLFPRRRRERMTRLLDELGETLWYWIMGRLASMTIIGVLTGIGLWFFGIPMPILLGVLAGLLTFIPNIGSALAVVPPLLLALQQGPWTAVYVGCYYLAIQFLESYFITPLIQQRAVSVPPALLLTAQLIMGVLTGFIGLAMATPLTATAIVLLKRLYVEETLEQVPPGPVDQSAFEQHD